MAGGRTSDWCPHLYSSATFPTLRRPGQRGNIGESKKLEDLLECRLNTSPIPMGTTTRGTSSWSNRLALKQPSPCTEESIPRVHQCLNYDAGPPGIPAEPSKTCFADSFKVLRGTYPRIYLTVVVCASRLRWKI